MSNGYAFRTTSNDELTVRPCCWFLSDGKFDEKLKINHTEEFNKITDWTPHCRRCKILEDAGHHSLRMTSFDLIPENSKLNDMVSMDVQLDVHCNGACVTCIPKLSSLWQKEFVKHNRATFKIDNLVSSVDEKIIKLKNTANLDHLRYIKFYGGEPLLTDTHLRILEQIPYPENVALYYTTNGSIMPSTSTLELWSKFKTIFFSVSIDGVAEQFNYLRWPLQWNKVTENLLTLKEAAPVNLMFRIEFTANLLNTYYYDRLEKWVFENLPTNRVTDPTEINIHSCVGTWDLNKMPPKVIEAVLKKYNPDHRIFNLVKQIAIHQSLDEWKTFVDKWEPIRKNSWREVFPEISEYYE